MLSSKQAAAVTGDPHFGLHFAMHRHEAARQYFGVFRFLMFSSPNLRVTCERLVGYQRFWNAGDVYEVACQDDAFLLRYRSWGRWREAHRHVAEKTVAGVVAMLRSVEPTCRPLAVRFPHGPVGDQAEITDVLGVAPTYGAGWTEVALPSAAMDKPTASADPALFRLSDRYLTMRLPVLAEREISSTARARAAVQQALHTGAYSGAVVARLLGCGGRTLQRRLAEEGTTLRKLVDEERKVRARGLVESNLSIAEVSFLLGYSEPAAFQHAFRRWYAMSPKTWRNTPKGAGDGMHVGAQFSGRRESRSRTLNPPRTRRESMSSPARALHAAGDLRR